MHVLGVANQTPTVLADKTNFKIIYFISHLYSN